MKLVLLFLVVFLTIGVTLSASFLESLGFDTNYMLIVLGAIVITGMVAFRGLALIVLTFLLSIVINLPEDFLVNYGVDRDILFMAVILLIIFPLIYREYAARQ